MNTSTVSTSIRYTRQELLRQEDAAFRRIPGMEQLRRAAPEKFPELERRYPDAAFALMISNNLFTGDREQNEIHQRAYAAILNGESVPSVRFRYDYDLERYLSDHMWD